MKFLDFFNFSDVNLAIDLLNELNDLTNSLSNQAKTIIESDNKDKDDDESDISS